MKSSKRFSTTGNELHRTIYEVHRKRLVGRGTAAVVEYLGLDRARLAGFAHALDGPSCPAESFSGTIRINQVDYVGQHRLRTELIDLIDERVAFRILNELTIPHANRFSVSIEALQKEVDRLTD